MKSRNFFDELVSDLTELEMQSLLEACFTVVNNNHWEEMRDEALDIDLPDIDALENELQDAERAKEKAEDELDDYKYAVKQAIKALSENNIEDVKQILTEI